MRNLLLSLAVAALLWAPAFSQHETAAHATGHHVSNSDDFDQHTQAAMVAIAGALVFFGVCGLTYWHGFVTGEDRR